MSYPAVYVHTHIVSVRVYSGQAGTQVLLRLRTQSSTHTGQLSLTAAVCPRGNSRCNPKVVLWGVLRCSMIMMVKVRLVR